MNITRNQSIAVRNETHTAFNQLTIALELLEDLDEEFFSWADFERLTESISANPSLHYAKFNAILTAVQLAFDELQQIHDPNVAADRFATQIEHCRAYMPLMNAEGDGDDDAE